MSSIGKLTFFLGLQVKQSEEGIFISQDKYVAEILKKFDFAHVRIASTPIETQKPLVKDEEATDVDVHLYRSMIRSLMYLKGQPKLSLWYPRDSPFDLEAYSDSDYARANLDMKSTTGGCQFLDRRLISWQYKKQTIVATSTTEAEEDWSNAEFYKIVDFFTLSSIIMLSLGESLVRAATTASLDAQQDSSNIAKTQSKETLNEPNPQGEVSGSHLGHQETIGGAMAQIRFKGAPIQSNDPPLSASNTVGNEEVIVEDNGSSEKGGSTAEIVSIARPNISAARPEGAVDCHTDFDVTIADTLVKMKTQKAKEKGVAFKDVDDSARPIRSITTLQPLPTIDPKDKDEEVRTETERQKEASKAALAELHYDFQAQIDADHELAARLTHKEQEKFTVKERMLKVLDRQDVLDLHKIVIERFPANDPEGYDLILWGDLKTLMESSKDDEIWRNQQDRNLLSWKLYETCGVHTLILDDSLASINIFV
uniref:Copia protein n=1 Tax=Tanacetum cinerariifolium TaxID=118510 RepID=A0A699IIS0_TANCI|nr:copia protein [Tanacetum cinerariifolium]